jgi:NADPH:quinone reductase-like Zn-dependent oxidoreductase
VLLRVGAAGVNNTDINTRIGWYSKSVAADTAAAARQAPPDAAAAGWSGSAFVFPRIQGADACGRIVAVGAGVAVARIGERVLVDPVLRPPGGELTGVQYLGADRDGAFAEYVAVPASNAHRIETTLSDAELAAFPCAYSAAENMLDRAAVAAGETVLITGASGGVGAAAVQLARQRGAEVIAQTTRDKAADVRALGAQQIIERGVDLPVQLGRETVDVVVDVVGGTAFPALLEVLRRGGRYAVAGAIAGPIATLDLRTLYLKDLRLLGCTVTPAGVFARLVRLIESGQLRAPVRVTYPLAEIAAAQSDFLDKAQAGKIVLLP